MRALAPRAQPAPVETATAHSQARQQGQSDKPPGAASASPAVGIRVCWDVLRSELCGERRRMRG